MRTRRQRREEKRTRLPRCCPDCKRVGGRHQVHWWTRDGGQVEEHVTTAACTCARGRAYTAIAQLPVVLSHLRTRPNVERVMVDPTPKERAWP